MTKDTTNRISKTEKKLAKTELKNKLAQERMMKIEKRNDDKIKAIKIGGSFGSSLKADEERGDKKNRPSFLNRKEKKEKEKINWRLAFKEFPVKMAKEISRIRWVPKGSLGKRFLVVILFIIAFAIFYEVIDEILIHIFNVAYVI